MNGVRCVKCRHSMKKVSGVNRMFLGRYVISDTTLFVCEKCGEEFIEDKEYERIRKKIEEIESRMKIAAVHEVLAKTKFLVL